MSELCRMFGVSRQTGHDWLKRYRDSGTLDALADKSKRPHTSPTKTSEESEELLVAARKQRPTWGARKLRHVLLERCPSVEWPSPSCITAILVRHGLVMKRRKRRKAPVITKLPFAECDHGNAVWCIDFKGTFRTRDGVWCHVLTLEDAYSRFLLRAEAVFDSDGDEVERILDGAFQESNGSIAHWRRSSDHPRRTCVLNGARSITGDTTTTTCAPTRHLGCACLPMPTNARPGPIQGSS